MQGDDDVGKVAAAVPVIICILQQFLLLVLFIYLLLLLLRCREGAAVTCDGRLFVIVNDDGSRWRERERMI